MHTRFYAIQIHLKTHIYIIAEQQYGQTTVAANNEHEEKERKQKK